MGYANHIGRVGALAVVLGVGVGVGAPAVGYAQPSGSGSSAADSSATDPSPEDADSSSGAPGSPESSAGGDAPSQQVQRSGVAPTVLAATSGGAHPVVEDDGDSTDISHDASDGEDTERGPALVQGPQPPPPAGAVSRYGDVRGARSAGRDAPDRRQSQRTNGAAGRRVDRDWTPPAVAHPTPPMVGAGRSGRQPSVAAMAEVAAGGTQSSAAQHAEPVLGMRRTIAVGAARRAPAAELPAAPVRLASALVSALVGPLLAPGRGVPAQAPPLWGVLAWVRREVERTFVNQTPAVRPQHVSLVLDDPVEIPDPIAFDAVDPDVDTLSYTVPQRGGPGGPSHGTVTIDQATGTFTYEPDDSFARAGGDDTFTVTASDQRSGFHLHGLLGLFHQGGAHRDSATVTVTVAPTNTRPLAVDDKFEIDEDHSLTLTAARVLANDSDPDGDELTVQRVSDPAHGVVVVNDDGSCTYMPEGDFFGTDSFTYTASDGVTVSDPATVIITVAGVNDAPVALDDRYSINEDQSLIADAASDTGVLANDSDPDGDVLRALPVSLPANGTLALAEDGSFIYTPDINFSGTDKFVYLAADRGSTVSVATVTITVNSVNDAPMAVADVYATLEDTPLSISAPGVLANDGDPDGDALMAVIPGAAHGTVAWSDNGSFTYTPNRGFTGVDRFAYYVSDGVAVSQATVTITVDAVNHVPRVGDPAFSVDDIDGVSGMVTGSVNVSDPDNDILSYAIGIAPDPALGAVTLYPDGVWTFGPTDDARRNALLTDDAQTAVFTITATDDKRGSTPAAIAVAAPIVAAAAAVGATIHVGGFPIVMAISPDPDDQRLYVVNRNDGTVTVINTATNTVIDPDNVPSNGIQTIGVGNAPSAVAISPAGDRLYVANFGDDTVSVIDTQTYAINHTITVGDKPFALAVHPAGDRLYVADSGGSTVSVIDTDDDGIQQITVGNGPRALAVSPGGDRLYIIAGGKLSAVDITIDRGPTDGVINARFTLLEHVISSLAAPTHLAVGPGGDRLYVANLSGTVVMIDTENTVGPQFITVGHQPTAMAVSPDGNRLYITRVTDSGAGVVSVIDTRTQSVVDTVATGGLPSAVVVHPDGDRIYVTNREGYVVEIKVADTTRQL